MQLRLAQRRRRSWSIVLATAACLSGLSLTACHREAGTSSTVSVETQITPQPVVVGPVVVTVKLADAHGDPVTKARLTVEGDMSHAGMAPVEAEALELPGGKYQAKLQFGMPGDWVILVHGKLPDGQTLERQVDVRGVRSN
jgi:hypothetical protein